MTICLFEELAANEIFLLLGGVFFIGVVIVWLTDFQRHGERVSLLDGPGKVQDFAPHA